MFLLVVQGVVLLRGAGAGAVPHRFRLVLLLLHPPRAGGLITAPPPPPALGVPSVGRRAKCVVILCLWGQLGQ